MVYSIYIQEKGELRRFRYKIPKTGVITSWKMLQEDLKNTVNFSSKEAAIKRLEKIAHLISNPKLFVVSDKKEYQSKKHSSIGFGFKDFDEFEDYEVDILTESDTSVTKINVNVPIPEHVLHHVRLLDEFTKGKQQAEYDLREYDRETQDFLHLIESDFHKFDAATAYLLLKKLHEIRVNRRAAKDILAYHEQINNVDIYSNSSDNYVKKISLRSYQIRTKKFEPYFNNVRDAVRDAI